MSDKKKRILVCIDWFDPGYKAGGPIRSVVNFVKHMQAGFDIYVLTSDRDLGATEGYAGIATDTWLAYDARVKVWYASPAQLNWRNLKHIMQQVQPDVVYLNSMFSKYFTIYPLLLLRAGAQNRIVLAPRGMLKASALQFKSGKKKIFLFLFRFLGLPRKIIFQATDTTEHNDVKKTFGNDVKVVTAPNFPGYVPAYKVSAAKNRQELKIVFIGRIHPIKNLHFLLQCLGNLTGTVSLTVVGGKEDTEYAQECETIARKLPGNVSIYFAGEIPNKDLPDILTRHHIFALPTKGENFGHAIFEALAAGKPVLISDQTPWRGLHEAQAGWDISLQQPAAFREALQQALDFDQQQYNQWSQAAWQFVQGYVSSSDLTNQYNKLFS